MVKYSKYFKEQALLLPNELEVKKAASKLGINYCTIGRVEEGRSKRRENRIGQNAVERAELSMQQAIQELKKARFNCGNKILLP